MIGPGQIRPVVRAFLAGTRALPALAFAVSLLVAPLHSAAHHHSDSGAQTCAVCSLAKSPFETSGIVYAVVPFDSVETFGLPTDVASPFSTPVDLLPLEHGPPSRPVVS